MKSKLKKALAVAAALALLLALSGCAKPGASLDLSGISLAGRVENIKGSTVTVTIGVISDSLPSMDGGGQQNNAAVNNGNSPGNVTEGAGDGSTGNVNGGDMTDDNMTGGSMTGGGSTTGDNSTGNGSTAGDNNTGNGNTAGNGSTTAGNNRFISSGRTASITINDQSLIKSVDATGASASLKLSELKVGDIITIDFDSSGSITGFVVRRDVTEYGA